LGRTALLIIDMQNDFCLPGAPFYVNGALEVAARIEEALAACRRHGVPVIHVKREYEPDGSDVEITRYPYFVQVGGGVVRGTKGAEIVEPLRPQAGEPVIVKKRWSAFFRTELDRLLRELGVTRLVVTGVQTPNCIRATVWDANSLDYEVIVLTDGTGAQTPEVHAANLRDMANIGIRLMTTQEFIAGLPALAEA